MTAQEILETPDLIAAGIAGDEVRRRLQGTVTSFVRVLEMHVDAVPQALPPRADPGEVRIVGRPASREAAVEAVRAAHALAAGVPLTGFSLDDLMHLGPIREVASALKDAGLGAIAHLPIDAVADPERAADDVRDAGLCINAMTVLQLQDGLALELCERARHLQGAVGGFMAFAPLPRTLSVTKPTTGYDDVKQIALARIVVEDVPSIQVDWQLYGPKMAQVALTVGANDVDNVSAVDPGILGTRRSPLEEIRTNITSAFLEPVERDGRFNRR